MARKITFTSALSDDIDERVEKIQQIAWDLRNSNRDLWKDNQLHSKVSEFEQLKWLSEWLKDFRINPR
jgi:hypothetical protein